MSLSVIVGASMLACSGGEMATVEPPAVEPVLQVNGHPLAPFYAEWNPPDGEPDLGDIMMLPAADIIRIALIDGADTFRNVDVRVYDLGTSTGSDAGLKPAIMADHLHPPVEVTEFGYSSDVGWRQSPQQPPLPGPEGRATAYFV